MVSRTLRSRLAGWAGFLASARPGLLTMTLALFWGHHALPQDQIDLGTVVTVLDGAVFERRFTQEDIAASTAISLGEFLSDNNCLVLATGGTGAATTVSIRGYAGATIKVYVDGVLANNPSTGEFDWNSLALESIESITIQDTPILGQEEFAGTIIAISTKSFSARKTSLTFSSRSYETNPFDTNHFGLTLQDVVAGTAVRLSTGGTTAANRFRQVDGSVREGNGYQAANGVIGWSRFVGSHSVGGSHSISYNRLQLPPSLSASGVQTDLLTAHSLFGDLLLPFGHAKMQFSYNLNDLKYGEEADGTASSGNSSAQNTDNRFHHLSLQLDYTTPYHAPNPDSPAFLNGLLNSQPSFSLKGGAILSDFSSGGAAITSPSRYSLYPSFSLVLFRGQPLQVQPMAGYLLTWDRPDTASGQETVFHHSFNGALAINFLNLTLSVSTQNTLPTFNQLYWNYATLTSAVDSGGGGNLDYHGNPDLQPESGYSLRLKFSTHVAGPDGESAVSLGPIPLTASIGFSYYQNKIVWVRGRYEGLPFTTMHTANSGAAYYFDGTLQSQKTFALTKDWRLGYSLQVAVTKTFLLDEAYYGNQIMWVPLVLANCAVEAGYKDWRLHVGYDFTSRRYTSNYNTSYYAPIHLLSCALAWQYSENLAFTLEGSNLLGQKYLFHDNYSGPSRSYTVKVKASF